MQTTTTRLHPLLAAAAVSLIVLSGVGVAAMTGLIPVTKSHDSSPEIPSEIVKPIAPVISHPVTTTSGKSKPVAQALPVVESLPVAQAPTRQAPAGQLATVESVREIKAPGDAKGVGAIAGGVVGGVLGKQLGKGKGLGMVLGAAAGAFAGHQIEKQVRADKRWEIALRLDDGSQRMLPSEAEPAWRAGDRVRIVDSHLQAI